MKERNCKTCDRPFRISDEFFYRDSRGYLSFVCKGCTIKRSKRWKDEHRGPKAPQRERNCELCKKRFLGPYQRRCPDCISNRAEWNKLRVFRNKARSLGGCAKTRAKWGSVRYALTHRQITMVFAATSHCPICGRELNYENRGGGFSPASPSLDRLIPSLGYVATNTAVICTRCNILKQDATLAELEAIVRWMKTVSGDQVAPCR